MKRFQKWLLTITLKRLVNKAERKIKNVHKSVKKFCRFVILNISMDLTDKKKRIFKSCNEYGKAGELSKVSKKMQKNKKLNMVAGLICQPGREDLMVNV